MRKGKIAAAIITKNEGKNIAGCIERVAGWADEVIVIDGFSEDKTAEIAKKKGAKVITHRFEGDFSVERNKAMENTACDWVLHLDADDRVTEEFKRVVDDVIDSDPSINIYKFRRKNIFLGHFMEYGGWYHSIPNLTRRAKVRFEGRLHERPVAEGETGEINADIEHHPYGSIAQFVERHNRYSSIEAERIAEENKNISVKEIKKNMIGRTVKIFWKMYVKKKGYKEGAHGLVFAVLFALTNFLTWAKVWEKTINKSMR